jgi:AcrR family transcriptional regulator
MSVRIRPSLLDMAAEVLVADPAASLAEVAEAAGIGRTTLHKHYATRDDLLRAVALRVIEQWNEAVAQVEDTPGAGLRELAAALVQIGPQLAFLWRTPDLDHVTEVHGRWKEAENRALSILLRAQADGVLNPRTPDWWLLQTFYSLVYVAAESVHSGHLASRDAPDLALTTFLHGLSIPAP